MTPAYELSQVAPHLLIWQAYDPAAKADLFSSAIVTSQGTFLVDPVRLDGTALAELPMTDQSGGIIVTNRNHVRACHEFAERYSLAIFAHPATFEDQPPPPFNPVADGAKIHETLEVVTIDGAAPGEIAVHSSADGGTLLVGDALINFEPYGFTFLPGKYCSNEKQMRQSLRKLANRKYERMLFAHGTPILSKADARLQQLVDGDR